MITETDLAHLTRAVELAEQALQTGDEPFGSVLVEGTGNRVFEDHNHIAGGDNTQHPEFAIARWAANNMTPEQRAKAVVYTSGEHCPMCAAAHAWVGLGRVVYASSSAQLSEWLEEIGVAKPPVSTLPINDIAPGVPVEGPVAELAEKVKTLHRRCHDTGASI